MTYRCRVNRCDTGINRYIMECKYTWQDAFRARLNPELIDTLWNVNSGMSISFLTEKRINRYIMECK